MKNISKNTLFCALISLFASSYIYAGEESSKIWMRTLSWGVSGMNGKAYLIPKSTDVVRESFLSNPQAIKDFKEKRKQATLDEIGSSDWTNVYYSYHSQAYSADKQRRIALLKEGQKAGIITAEENKLWSELIQNETVSDNQSTPSILKNPIARYEFQKYETGTTGIALNDYNIKEFVIIMDVTPFFGDEQNKKPLTLLWHGGEKSIAVKTHFELTSCMTGVTCFPNPHWETKNEISQFSTQELDRHLSKILQKLETLPSAETLRLKNALEAYRTNEKEAKKVPLNPLDGAISQAVFYPLNIAHSYDQPDHAIKPLPDGSFASTIGAKDGANIFTLAKDGVKIAKTDKKESLFVNSRDKKNDEEKWLYTLQSQRNNLADLAKPPHCSLPLWLSLDLGDGLLWYANPGFFGVSPTTKKIQKSYPCNTRDMFLGSAYGDWVVSKNNGGFAVTRLSNAKEIFHLASSNASYSHGFARSAHGLLMAATGSSKFIEVWNMRTGKNVARISVPEKYKVTSIAFDWSGAKLWAQVTPEGTYNGKEGVLIWDVPSELRDSADKKGKPHQLVNGLGVGSEWLE